ncbi:uncharacterized protein LOC125294548 [Alosa alosa]|uniref:uncharacterized protein LOC125294548 n=1 Tax=Alosa alosa TaxID=278164 RepID=UPI0020155353|nr:uncharacterized protein LOC125294548 [Alosa alosa]
MEHSSLQKWLELGGRDVCQKCLEVEFEIFQQKASMDMTGDSTDKKDHLKGQLQKAAELKADQSILIHIKDKDCVALEVQYHKGCYSQYTRFLTRPAKALKEQNEPMFDSSYRVFCERIIRQRLLINKEVLRMGQLRKAFIDLVKENEDIDASNYRLDMLKKRLTCDFPQLVFHMPTKRNICELVFVESLSKDTLVDMLPHPSGAETTQSSELSQTDSETEKGQTTRLQ